MSLSSTITMKELDQCLANLDLTMDKIKSFTHLALKSNPEHVYVSWEHELHRRRLDKKLDVLPIIYACNDIIQESFKLTEIHAAFVQLFDPRTSLKTEFKAVLKTRAELFPKIDKVLQIWIDRHMYPKGYVEELREELAFDREQSLYETGEEVEEEVLQTSKLSRQDSTTSWVEQKPTCVELQALRLKELNASQLLRLMHLVSTPQPSLDVHHHPISGLTTSQAVRDALNTTREQLVVLRKRRKLMQAREPVKEAAHIRMTEVMKGLESGLEMVQTGLGVCEVVLEAIDKRTTLKGTYISTNLVPKREQVVRQVVANGPILGEFGDRAVKTSEEALQSGRPMMYNKQLKMYVPVPSGDSADQWRD